MSISRLFDFFKPKSSSKPEQKKSFYQSIYPESVRYALKYKEAQLGKPEMEALIKDWTFEAVYLVVKAFAKDRENQRQYLEDLTRIYYRKDWKKEELQALLRTHIEKIPDDLTVTGTKLAQLSRTGSDNWQQKWRSLVEELYAEKPNALPCIIANTPLYAYNQIIDVYRQRHHAKLVLLMPDWMLDPYETQMGYEITLGPTPTVDFQVKDECLYGSWTCEGVDCQLKKRFCTEAIFIDDTINTAKTAGKLQSFWLTEYGLNMPIDRVRVITDLRDTAYVKKVMKQTE